MKRSGRSSGIIKLFVEKVIESLDNSNFLGHYGIHMKNKFSLLLVFFLTSTLFAEDETCAIMVGDEIDPEEFSEILGKKFIFVVGPASKHSTQIKLTTSKLFLHLPKSFPLLNKRNLALIK